MRLLLVGTPEERERFRAEIDHSSFTIAGEFRTLAQARASAVESDATLLCSRVAPAFTARAFEEPLTARELEVLNLLVEGLSNKMIAARLRISDQTVKFHVAAICGKLGAANRTDAVRRALRRGLVAL